MIAHPILFTLCFLAIWISEGVIQGWIKKSSRRRVEIWAVIGVIFSAVGISEQSGLLIFGLSGIGWFISERLLCRVNFGYWFPYKPDYLLWGLRIVRHPAQDMMVLFFAIALLGILWQGR